MRFSRITAVIAAASLMLSGCASLSLNGPDILAPPKASGSRAELQRMIEKDAGGAYTLLYPAYGEYKSGVIRYDLDKDGTEETVVLYTASDGTAHALLAQTRGDAYEPIGSAALNSSNLSSLRFADVDGDGTDELLIGCDAGTPLAELSAYLTGDGVTRVKIAEGFTDYVTGDFDGDKDDDALLLLPPGADLTAKAMLMCYENGSFSGKSVCDIDPDVLSCRKLSYGKINEDISGAVVDGVLESGELTTQLLYYDPTAQTLINPLFSLGGYDETLRSAPITSFDINGDGIIELPLCALAPYAKSEDSSAVCRMVHWSSYDAGDMETVPVTDAVLCDGMGFLFTVKPQLVGAVTARYNADNEMTLYRLDDQGEEPAAQTPLLTVKFYEKGSFDSSLIAEAVICESNTGVYTYVPSDVPGYTEDEVKNSFMLTENIS